MPMEPTDVMWMSKAPTERTTSLDSNDSDVGRRTSFTENIVTDQPDMMRPRRISITERILGCQAGGFSWGQAQAQYSTPGDTERKASITTDERFKELLKHQNKILSD